MVMQHCERCENSLLAVEKQVRQGWVNYEGTVNYSAISVQSLMIRYHAETKDGGLNIFDHNLMTTIPGGNVK